MDTTKVIPRQIRRLFRFRPRFPDGNSSLVTRFSSLPVRSTSRRYQEARGEAPKKSVTGTMPTA